MRRLLLAFVAVSLPSAAAAAEPVHAHGAMSAERAAQAELGATAAFDAKGDLWAAHKVSGHVAVSRSSDRGRTWSNPILVTPAPEATDTGADARPKIACGAAGELYVTWTRPLAKPYTGEIRFARSLDGGRTFSPPGVVHRDRQEITHRFDALAVNARGQVIVAWIDKRDLVAAATAKAPAYRGAAVYFAVSDDRGATFRGDFKLADHSCECCRIALACHADGSVTALWRHIFAPNVRDHALARLNPEGTGGPVRRASFDEWKIDACPHHGPGLAEDGHGQLHAVWYSGAPDQRGIFYGRLTDGAVAGQRRIGGAAAVHADVAASDESVVVAWKEFDGEKTQLRAIRSDDGGVAWRDLELAATAGPSDHPRVLAVEGNFHVFWPTRDQPLMVTAVP